MLLNPPLKIVKLIMNNNYKLRYNCIHNLFFMKVISTKPPQLGHSKVQEIIQNIYNIDASVLALNSERDQNFHLKGYDGNEYVLKISNPQEKIKLIQLQTAAMNHITTFDSSLNVPVTVKSIDGQIINYFGKSQGLRFDTVPPICLSHPQNYNINFPPSNLPPPWMNRLCSVPIDQRACFC